MKWILILVLVTSVAILGCTPAEKSTPEPVNESAPDPSFDDAMGTSVDTSVWLTDYNKALEQAKSMKRPVLVNFTGSDWCGWCIKLSNEVFTKDEFIAYAKSDLLLLKLDFPRGIPQTPEVKAANDKLAKQYGITGFPTIVLISPEGKEIARTGYQPGGAAAYVKHLQGLLATNK
jgi:protein disulfide-isomerase